MAPETGVEEARDTGLGESRLAPTDISVVGARSPIATLSFRVLTRRFVYATSIAAAMRGEGISSRSCVMLAATSGARFRSIKNQTRPSAK